MEKNAYHNKTHHKQILPCSLLSGSITKPCPGEWGLGLNQGGGRVICSLPVENAESPNHFALSPSILRKANSQVLSHWPSFQLPFKDAYAFLFLGLNYPHNLRGLPGQITFYTKERSLQTIAFLFNSSISQKAWV